MVTESNPTVQIDKRLYYRESYKLSEVQFWKVQKNLDAQPFLFKAWLLHT